MRKSRIYLEGQKQEYDDKNAFSLKKPINYLEYLV